MSGELTIEPGYEWPDAIVTKARLNQTAQPTGRVNAASVGTRELIAADVRQMVPNVSRSVLINGNFDVWQRGGFFNAIDLPLALGNSADEEFGPDRWSLGTPEGVNKRSIYRPAMPVGVSSGVPNEPEWYLHWDQVVAEAAPKLSQPIENVRTLAGKKAVVSWWMKSNKSGNVVCRLKQFWGGDPAPAARVVAATTGGTAALVSGADWKQYTATFDIPTLLGQSIGAGNALVLQFLLPVASTYTIDFSQVQMEEGEAATVFETLPLVAVQAACERYFEYHGGVMSDDISHHQPCFYFATRKYRDDPSLEFVGNPTGTGGAFSPISTIGYAQDAANDAVANFYLAADAEIYGVSD